MKKRYLYVLVFGAPILLASTIAAFAVFGAAAGFIWLFVAGDDAWPAATDTILVALFVLAFAATALALAALAYVTGKKREQERSGMRAPVVAAGAASAVLVLAIVAHQWRIGNLGAKPDSVVCSEFCMGKGSAGSSMPPRNSGLATCSCLDAQGREAITVPMETIRKD